MRKPTRSGGSLPMKSSAASMSMSLLPTSTRSIAITISFSVLWILRKKYVSNRKSYAHIRRVSDRLCWENGLSVVAPGAERGKQYAEWDAQRKGTSYKQKLKIAIDRLIPISKDLDDLLRRLEAEGYEIKRGKYISFRAPGQERFTRAKTLGEAYTEEAIAERIKGKVILKTPKPERSGVSLLIDIENCIKAQQSAGYERWAKIENLKRAARTMVFLDQHGISHYTDLEQKITELQDSNEQTAAALKTAEHRLPDLALLISICADVSAKSFSLKRRRGR